MTFYHDVHYRDIAVLREQRLNFTYHASHFELRYHIRVRWKLITRRSPGIYFDHQDHSACPAARRVNTHYPFHFTHTSYQV